VAGHAYIAGALPDARERARPAHRRVALLLSLAAGCVLALLGVWALADHVFAIEVRDAALLHDFTRLNGTHLGAVCRTLLRLLEPTLFTLWALAVTLFALARNRVRLAIALALVMGLAPLSAELLKHALAHSHVAIGYTRLGAASYPSGHATAATALALSAALVVPARRRALALLCALALIAAVGVALLIREWHLPSDVLGGYLLGVAWISLALAAVRASQICWPRTGRATRATPAAGESG